MAYLRTDLRLLHIHGADTRAFLNGLISQRTDLPVGAGSYGAFLTPQGKLLADFPLLCAGAEELVLALTAEAFEGTLKKLSMFKLRSAVTLREMSERVLVTQVGEDAPLRFHDPRHAAISHDLQPADSTGEEPEGFHAARARLGVVEGAYDLEIGKSTLLDEGLACAIDWDKGCYMGQEVTARMRYRALIKRVLVPFSGTGKAGHALMDGARKVGVVRSAYGACGFAYVQKDYVGQSLEGLALGNSIGLAGLVKV